MLFEDSSNFPTSSAMNEQMLMKSAHSLSFRKRIEVEITQLEHQLENKKKMLALIDANPAIEQFMDLSRGY